MFTHDDTSDDTSNNTTSDDTIEEEVLFCYNCQRSHVNLQYKPWREICKFTRKTYFSVSLRHVQVALCSQCEIYLTTGSTKGYWPAMIWCFLSAKSSVFTTPSLRERWKYIPLVWRGWWINAVENAGITMLDPPPEVVDVTIQKNDLNSALCSLQWKNIAPAMDKYLMVPTVRCPWGCGCYLHQTNEVSYEELLLVKSNFSFASTTALNYNHQRRKWVDSARPDFPSSTLILDCDNFVCYPSVILKNDGPYLLCCKKHNRNTIERVVHIPTNPTGSLFTEASNQYAPVVLKSRTLRKAKLNQYSDTYKTVELQGGYDGVDSAYCSSIGNRRVTNHLSRQRDYLSLKGRQDVRHNFNMLCESYESATYLPRVNIDKMLHQATIQYPDVHESFAGPLAGATYVPVEDAILMQESAYDEQPVTLLVGEDEEADIFEPPWPSNMIRVHPYDSHGERFTSIEPPITVMDVEGFHLWSILCCFLCVDEIWNIASRSMRNDSDVVGYLMALAWQQRRKDTNRTGSQRSRKFFNLTNVIEEGNEEITTVHNLVYELNAFDTAAALSWPTIPGNERIGTLQHYWNPDNIPLKNDYVVVTFSEQQDVLYRENPDESKSLSYRETGEIPFITDEWEAVLLVTQLHVSRSKKKQWDGAVYARHGGMQNTGWWLQQGTGAVFRKCNNEKEREISIPDVRLLVCRKKGKCTHTTYLRDCYLNYLGGQSAVFCAAHKSPLIMSYKDDLKCCCDGNDIASTGQEWIALGEKGYCTRDPNLVCPHLGCKTAICEQDFGILCNGIGTGCYLLSPHFCKKASYEGAIATPEHQTTGNIDEHDGIFHNRTLEPTWDDESDSTEASMFGDKKVSSDYFGIEETHELISDLLGEKDDSSDETFEYNNEQHQVGPLHPMTVAHSEEVLQVELDTTEVESEQSKEVLSIPLHIFLNRQGHCLIRRDAKLRPV
jgi:hypothetical protein